MPTRNERRSRLGTQKSSLGTYVAIGVVALVVVIAIVVAILLSADSNDSGFDHSSYSVQLSGVSLSRLTPPTDTSVGRIAPAVIGTDFDGNRVEILPDGRPTVILFLAHWCSHCQSEVRLLTPWFVENGLPSSVRIVSIVTSIDASAPNFPPDRWLADWPVPVIVDNAQETAAAYFGLSAFPFWVVLDGDGTVLARFTGELEAGEFAGLIQELS